MRSSLSGCLAVAKNTALIACLIAGHAQAQGPTDFRFELRGRIDLAIGEESGAHSLVVADVNRDGRPDIVAINRDDDQVSVLLGRGDGQFEAARRFDLDATPTAVAVADVTSDFSDGSAAPDGVPDLILATEDGYPLILIGDGSGDFDASDAQDLSDLVDGSRLVDLAAADFDSDGRLDVALLDADDRVFLICNSDGSYVPCRDDVLPTRGDGPLGMAVGDFDGDGHRDIAVLSSLSKNVSVMYGSGDGAFSPARTFTAAAFEDNEPRALTAGRLDADDLDDLVIVSSHVFGDLGLLSLRSVRRNQFDSQVVASPSEPTAVALADLNGDGLVDAVITDRSNDGTGGPVILPGVGEGRFFESGGFGAGGTSRLGRGLALAVADVGNDTLPDLVVVRADGESLQVAINLSNEPFTPTPTLTAPPPTVTATVPPTAVSTATATLPPPPTATVRRSDNDGGCAIGGRPGHSAVELMGFLAPLALLARRRRSPRRAGAVQPHAPPRRGDLTN